MTLKLYPFLCIDTIHFTCIVLLFLPGQNFQFTLTWLAHPGADVSTAISPQIIVHFCGDMLVMLAKE
jgi:hypothetical protein